MIFLFTLLCNYINICLWIFSWNCRLRADRNLPISLTFNTPAAAFFGRHSNQQTMILHHRVTSALLLLLLLLLLL